MHFNIDYGYRRYKRKLGLYIGYVGIGHDSFLFSESYLLVLSWTPSFENTKVFVLHSGHLR